MKEQNIKTAIGGDIKFYEELPRVKKEEIIGLRFKLRDARIVEDWDGQWGATDFALLKLELPENKEVTTLCGGVAVVRQIRKLLKRNMLPGRIWCFLNLIDNEDGQQYYLLDWDEGSEAIVKGQQPVENEKPVETQGAAS